MITDQRIAGLEREISDEVARRRRTEIEALGRDALLWLTVVPSWTRSLARQCEFPVADLDTFVGSAASLGLCSVSEGNERGDQPELRLLAALAAHLPPRLLSLALESATRSIQSAPAALGLTSLAPYLDSAQLDQAMRAALSIQRPAGRATTVVGLFPELESAHAERYLDAAVESVLAVPRADLRPVLLGGLARRFFGPRRGWLVRQALEAAGQLRDAAEQAGALVAIADLHRESHRALGVAGRIEDPATSARTLLDLAAKVDTSVAGEAIRLARVKAYACDDLADRTALLLQIIERQVRTRPDEALKAADSIEDIEARALAYGRMMITADLTPVGGPRTAGNMLSRTRGLVAAVQDPTARIHLLSKIVGADDKRPNSTGRPAMWSPAARSLLDLAVQAVEELSSNSELAGPLAALTPVLGRAGLTDASRMMAERGIRAADEIVILSRQMLRGLSFTPWLSRAQAVEVLAEYRRTVNTVEDFTTRLGLLTRLVPQLDADDRGGLIEDALAAVRTEGAGDRFWATTPARRRLLEQVGDGGFELTGGKLQAVVVDIAHKILAAGEQRSRIPAATIRWARFAESLRSDGAAAAAAGFLDKRVSQALAGRDLPGALDWVDTAELLASTVGSELDGSVRYAARRIELAYRRRQDERETLTVLRRNEQIEAFEQLLADDEMWALHYVGNGGVGKSTLISQLARNADSYGMAIGRVDFDYLTPDYPVERPAALLLELMAELQLYAPGAHEESIVAAFHQSVAALHETWGKVPPDHRPRPLDDPSFLVVLRTFCDYVQLLGRRIVLFLDTCEELARWQPEGTALPNVEATFDMLSRLRTELAERDVDLRVVLAGRRALAAGNSRDGAAGWTIDDAEDSALPTRGFLRVHQIRGFTHDQAVHYLREIRQLTVPDDVLAAVLSRSEETAALTVVQAKASGSDEPRYLPFDIALYADWLLSDSDLSARDISSDGVDLYIDRRIVHRVKSKQARRLLPALATIRRPDAALLAAAFDGTRNEFREAFESLSEHEWIRRRLHAENPSGSTLQVEPRLQRRLRTYFEQNDRILRTKRVQLALRKELIARFERGDFGELPPLLVDDAFRLLGPVDSVTWMHTLLMAAAQRERWDWIGDVIRQLMGEDGVIGLDSRHPGRPVILAAHAAWLTHNGRASEAVAFWHSVLDSLDQEGDELRQAWLRQRSRLGLLADLARAERRPALDAVRELTELAGEFVTLAERCRAGERDQLVASWCATLDALVDRFGQRYDNYGIRLAEVARPMCAALNQLELPSPLAAQVARIELLFATTLGERPSNELLQRSAQLARLLDKPTRQCWFDLVLPASLRDRLRLELLLPRADDLAPGSLWPLTDWASEAGRSIDGERLRARALDELLASGPVEDHLLYRIYSEEIYEKPLQAACAAHRVTPPLFAVVAKGLLVLGRGGDALDVLERRLTPGDREINRAVQLAILHVLRRLRLTSHRELVDRCVQSDDQELRESALAVIALTDDPERIRTIVPAPWRYQSLFGRRARQHLWGMGEDLQRSRVVYRSGPATAQDVSEAIDLREWIALSGAPGGSDPDPQVVLRLDPESRARAAARLSVFDARFEGLLRELAGFLGARRVGEIAFEEGELLALRLPLQAAELLDRAAIYLGDSGDLVGQRLATLRSATALAHADPQLLHPPGQREILAEAARAVRDLPIGRSDRPQAGDTIRHVASGWAERQSIATEWAWSDLRRRRRQGDEHGKPVELRLHGLEAGQDDRLRMMRSAGVAAGGLVGAGGVLSWIGLGSQLLSALGLGMAVGLAGFALPWIAALTARAVFASLRQLGAVRTDARVVVRTASATAPDGWGTDPLELELRLRVPAFAALLPEEIGTAGTRLVKALVRRRRMSLTATRERTVATIKWSPLPFHSYRDQAVSFGREAKPFLRKLRVLRRTAVRLRVEAGYDASGVPWEAILVRCLIDDRRRYDLHVGRTWGSPAHQPSDSRIEPSWATDSVAGESSGRDVLVSLRSSSAWRRWAADKWGSVADVVRPSLVPHADIDVVHAIGRPTTARTGDGLIIAGEQQPQLTAAELVPRNGPRLVVLQAEPYGYQARMDTDRDATARLKRLAHGVLQRSGAAVIVIPSLPPSLAAQVVEFLVKRLVHQQNSVFTVRVTESELLRARGDAAVLIRAWSGWRALGGELAAELADDICVFSQEAR